MNIRPVITAPLPWLVILINRFFRSRAPDKALKKRASIFKLPRTLSVTSEGKKFIVVLFLIGFAAINTANNLLYLVLATMLSLIIISGLISESTLRGISVTRVARPRIQRGAPSKVRLTITNKKSLLPSYSLFVREAQVPGVAMDSAYVLKLSSTEGTVRAQNYTFERRGLNTLKGLKVSTRFPFGLFLKGRELDIEDEVLVYPRVSKLDIPPFLTGVSADGNAIAKKGGGVHLHSLREYTPRDDSRFIHWKSTARTMRLIQKEFESETLKKVMIVFDNYCEPGMEELFEKKVDEAASIASHLIERGYGVGLSTKSGELTSGVGREHLDRILRSLAFVRPAPTPGVPELKTVVL